MGPTLFIFCIFIFIQVLTSSAQSSLKHYFHVAGVSPHSHSAGITNVPTVGYARQPVPSSVAAVPTSGLTLPNSGKGGAPNAAINALGALASIPGLLQALTSASATPQQPTKPPTPTPVVVSNPVPTLKKQSHQSTTQNAVVPSLPTSKQNSPATETNGGLDSGVLNNLAIALQLLIVSNILNSNLPENEANPIYEMLETVKNIPVSLSQTQSSSYSSSSTPQAYQDPSFAEFEKYSEPSYIPSANFVGTSGFTEHTVTDPYIKPTSRNSFQLMSPYEALAPNSPFSDPILGSSYGSIMTSKRDFQSPYIMMDSDPFSNDLFS